MKPMKPMNDLLGIMAEASALRELLEHLFTGQGYLIETMGGDGEWRREDDPSPKIVDPRHHTLEAVMVRAESANAECEWRIRPRGFFDAEAYKVKLEAEFEARVAEEAARPKTYPSPAVVPSSLPHLPPSYRPLLCRIGMHLWAPAALASGGPSRHLVCIRCEKPGKAR